MFKGDLDAAGPADGAGQALPRLRPAKTIAMWANVRRGEKLYISPFKNKANLMLDTALEYELPVMNHIATGSSPPYPRGRAI